jgi:hypothetical protein
MDESGGKCAVLTIPERIVMELRKLQVNVLGEQRPLALPDIRYGDEPWTILKKWAARSCCEHAVFLAHHPGSAGKSVRHVLGNGSYQIVGQFRDELKSLCKECSEESREHRKDFQHEVPERLNSGSCRSPLGAGEHFYHGKYSWDTLPAKLQSPLSKYPLLSRMPENAYICDMMYQYPDCLIIVRVHKKSKLF